jgi:hypothetical protein
VPSNLVNANSKQNYFQFHGSHCKYEKGVPFGLPISRSIFKNFLQNLEGKFIISSSKSKTLINYPTGCRRRHCTPDLLIYFMLPSIYGSGKSLWEPLMVLTDLCVIYRSVIYLIKLVTCLYLVPYICCRHLSKYIVPLRPVLILISPLPLRLSIVPFPLVFTTKTLYAVFISPIYSTLPANLNLFDFILMIILPRNKKLCCFDSKCQYVLVCVVMFNCSMIWNFIEMYYGFRKTCLYSYRNNDPSKSSLIDYSVGVVAIFPTEI